MVKIGKINTLKIVKEVDFGMYLDGGEDFGEILLPTRYITPNCIVDEFVDVFIYLDSDDRVIATTDFPLAQVDDFIQLEVVAVNQVGAFLDWGLMKDLLIPFKEQRGELEEGQKVVVKVYLDEITERIAASTKVENFLDHTPPAYEINQEVDLFVYDKTSLGYKVIINNEHSGLIFHNEIFKEIKIGDKTKGYIKNIREDLKIDVYLQKSGYENNDVYVNIILDKLNDRSGFLELTDNSSPETIKHVLGISKKSFKKAVGSLYKDKQIVIEPKGIRLLK